MRYSIYGYCREIPRDQAKIWEIDLTPGKNDIIGNETHCQRKNSMKPTNQDTMPTDNAHYETLKATITDLSRRELEAVALRLAELCDEQDKTIKGHEELADQLLPLIKDAYPQYDGPTRVQDEVPVTYCHTIH
jgi:hypothetical protein